jgi:hypothetical protein
MPTKDGWRRCDRSHPHNDEDVLCLNDTGEYFIGRWDEDLEGGRWRLYGEGPLFDQNPLYWQRLADRPKIVKWKY